jgi:hypothetical protein
VQAAVKANDAEKAKAALKRLTDRYPLSAEAAEEGKRVDALVAQASVPPRKRQTRMAALGFKALRTSPYFSHGDTSIGLTATAVVTRWNFDRHGDGWKFLDAEKGRKFVTATVTVRSKSQDPLLFGIGAYVANGSVLTYVGRMRYRFVRWRDYGSFLGTQADFRNDFTHTSAFLFRSACRSPTRSSSAGRSTWSPRAKAAIGASMSASGSRPSSTCRTTATRSSRR